MEETEERLSTGKCSISSVILHIYKRTAYLPCNGEFHLCKRYLCHSPVSILHRDRKDYRRCTGGNHKIFRTQHCMQSNNRLSEANYVEDLYPLAGIEPPNIRRDVCARVEKKQESNVAHSLYGQNPTESRLMSRSCFSLVAIR